MHFFFQVLASGSKGNAILIGSSKTRILLDVGLSARELTRRLDGTPTRANQLDAIIVSHEHSDHVRGVGVLSRRLDLPVYLTQGALEHLPSNVGEPAHIQIFRSGATFQIGDLRIQPFATCHDAREPVGFVIEHEGARLGICTDLGVVTQLVRNRLEGCQALVIESNHDTNLLIDGPYPWHLKQRIRGRHGHLSNTDASELLESLYHSELKTVVLAHLSETNNHPDLVLECIGNLCKESEWQAVSFQIGKQHEVCAPIEIRCPHIDHGAKESL